MLIVSRDILIQERTHNRWAGSRFPLSSLLSLLIRHCTVYLSVPYTAWNCTKRQLPPILNFYFIIILSNWPNSLRPSRTGDWLSGIWALKSAFIFACAFCALFFTCVITTVVHSPNVCCVCSGVGTQLVTCVCRYPICMQNSSNSVHKSRPRKMQCSRVAQFHHSWWLPLERRGLCSPEATQAWQDQHLSGQA